MAPEPAPWGQPGARPAGARHRHATLWVGDGSMWIDDAVLWTGLWGRFLFAPCAYRTACEVVAERTRPRHTAGVMVVGRSPTLRGAAHDLDADRGRELRVDANLNLVRAKVLERLGHGDAPAIDRHTQLVR